MQIKLIQTEIEEAVRNFIQEQVSVKEGMEINISFSATRGEEGLIASVEIARADDAKGDQGGHTHTAERAPAPSAAPAAIAVAAGTAEVAPAAPKATRRSASATAAAPTAAPKPDPVVAAQPEPELIPAEAEQSGDPVVAETAEEAPAPAAGKSLFGALKTPSNG